MESEYQFVTPVGDAERDDILARMTEREDVRDCSFSLRQDRLGATMVRHDDGSGPYRATFGDLDWTLVHLFVAPTGSFLWKAAQFLESGDTPTASVDFIEEDEPELKAG